MYVHGIQYTKRKKKPMGHDVLYVTDDTSRCVVDTHNIYIILRPVVIDDFEYLHTYMRKRATTKSLFLSTDLFVLKTEKD